MKHQRVIQHPAPHLTVFVPGSTDNQPRPRLLIVDDDAAIRELYAIVLHTKGYEVDTAGDGATALERLAAEKYDLVVTDRALPILDGASMVLALRRAGSNIPVIMVSTAIATTPLPRGVASELSAMVPKPARTAEILSAVAAALRDDSDRKNPCDFRVLPACCEA